MSLYQARMSLLRRQHQLAAELQTLDSSGPGDDETLDSLACQAARELLHIKQVLRKLGDCGNDVCRHCGHLIGPERRKAVPDTDCCVLCVDQTH